MIAVPLAYMTAKAHGMEEECSSILEASGMTEDQVALPSMGKPLNTPNVIVPTYNRNWPTKAASHTVFEEALMGQMEGEEPQAATNGLLDGEPEDLLGDTEQNGHFEAEEDEDAGGWDMGDDVPVEPEGEFVHVDGAEAGVGSSEAEMWSKTSPIAADHVAGGAYESAMQLLNRQVGAVNFVPLAARFEELYLGTRTFLPASAGMPPLVNYLRRTVDETDLRRIQPLIARDLESVRGKELQDGKKCMQGNKLEDGVRAFKRVLHLLMVNAVTSPQEVVTVRILLISFHGCKSFAHFAQAQETIASAAQYVLAMSIELQRRAMVGTTTDLSTVSEDMKKRCLELSAYFTIPEMDIAHQGLAWFTAMNLANRNKQFATALSFANRLIDQGKNTKQKESVSHSPATTRCCALSY